jgi:predicted transcriptional regulator
MFSVALRQCARSAAVRSSISRASPRVFANASAIRSMSTTVEEEVLASDAFKKSCYVAIDFTIAEDATVYDAVQRFSAYDIGALVTTDTDGKQLDSTEK